MEKTTRFCFHCGEPIDGASDAQTCPRCGDTLSTRTEQVSLESSTSEFVAVRGGATSEDSLVGSEFDHYRIEAFLGRGGTARVYLATHLPLERHCAIKILNVAQTTDAGDAVESLLSEARAAAALTHPHVVTIHTIGEDRGRHFIDMEYVDGKSLSRLIRERAPVDPIQAAQIMVQIGSALACAHGLGIIHRDIKPGNVMVTRSGEAKLADFGLAKRVSPSRPNDSTLSGTPNFMAPELYSGYESDERSDVYAMGVTYFCLLTGQLPFQAQTVNEIMQMHLNESIPDIRTFREEVSNEAATVIQRCLAKAPNDRFRDAADLFGELKAVYGSLRSLHDLLAEAFPDDQVTFEGSDDRFQAVIPIGESRTQTIYLELLRSGAISEQIIRIYSVCAPTDPQFFQRALELNSQIPHGSIGIDVVAGQPHFVMASAYPRATCDPEEIRQSVLSIAARADEIEQTLIGDDVH